MAGHYPGILMTGHIGTNTPKFLPPRWGRPPFDPTQTGAVQIRVGLELTELLHGQPNVSLPREDSTALQKDRLETGDDWGEMGDALPAVAREEDALQ